MFEVESLLPVVGTRVVGFSIKRWTIVMRTHPINKKNMYCSVFSKSYLVLISPNTVPSSPGPVSWWRKGLVQAISGVSVDGSFALLFLHEQAPRKYLD